MACGGGAKKVSHSPGVSGRAKGQIVLCPEEMELLRGAGPRSTEVPSRLARACSHDN